MELKTIARPALSDFVLNCLSIANNFDLVLNRFQKITLPRKLFRDFVVFS